ncbi:MAG: ATP-dependent DNA helicase RecG [Candidatus Cloacimonetes bacterium]|nr:ATP-dependent DNA helicase RecG [Candidatus Cloacimonadota bacterium]
MDTQERNSASAPTPLKFIKGVGEHRARLLGRLGITSALELMEFFPRTYISRILNPSLKQMIAGELISFTAQISFIDVHKTPKGKKILNLGVSDGEIGLTCVWFSFPASYEQLFRPGRRVWLNGVLSEYQGKLQMNHPEFELLEEDSEEEGDFWRDRETLPIYPLTEGLSQKQLRKIIYNAFEKHNRDIAEALPEELLEKHNFPDRRTALMTIHFGQDHQKIALARMRMAYEEFFYSQILWARHQMHHKIEVKGITFVNKKHYTTALKHKLPFRLTGAQARVITEIFDDMCSDKQMSRLIQGDVGSGKTIVCLFAMLLAVENGYQAALMAPTEILAEQHYQNISKLLAGIQIPIILLKGGTYKGKSQQKEEIREASGQIIIGTHALIQKDVEYKRLGLVVVDEQHRFGVEQRATLAKQESAPDLLYLSATPIPRSLAMTVYGDLQVSVIDELPPRRKKVITFLRSERKLDIVLQEVRQQLRQGRQAYFVCPLIEESEKKNLIDAQRLHEYLANKIYKEYRVSLMHGRMPASEKDAIMREFKAGEIQVLVSTTVIEVGVDVPNASVMVIEHAECFGLAQLHQLRGRVGRGADQAYCYLIEHVPLSRMARQRLSTMAITTDGFEIAEKDLELRGPGELFGYEQSGLPTFRFANLVKDQGILAIARADAFEIVKSDPYLADEKRKLLKHYYFANYLSKEELILY